jgi:hypothetical protein
MRHSQQPHPLSAANASDEKWTAMQEHLRSESTSEDGSPRRVSTDGEEHDMGDGWVESITGLRDGDGATDLLINGSNAAPISKVLLSFWTCSAVGLDA